MTSQRSEAEAWDKLWSLIGEIKTGMLTSVDGEHLRARPMRGHADGERRELWFFTHASAHKTAEIEQERQVAVAYARPDREEYVSLSGPARLVTDRTKIEQMWNPYVAAWFPGGKHDPDIGLIKVSVEQAEYWDSPSSSMVQLIQIARANLTGSEPKMGENRKLA